MTFRTILSALCMLGAMAVTSCEKADTKAYMPEFDGFVYQKPVEPGKPLTVVARQSAPGHLITTAKYRWNCKCDWVNDQEGTSGTTALPEYTKKVSYSLQSDNPTYTFDVPENAVRLAITFVAEYDYAGVGDMRYDGNTIVDSPGANGVIRPVTSNGFGGKTQGSLTIRIGTK